MPIRDEAINVFISQPGDGDEPRLELTYNFGVDSLRDRHRLRPHRDHAPRPRRDARRARRAGHRAREPPYRIREDGGRLCFVRDPDGYRIEIIERT